MGDSGDYINVNAIYPLDPLANLPGIALPKDFALEAADRSLTGPGNTGTPPVAEPASKNDRLRFPLRDVGFYGEAIARLVGAFSGPGFNLIFRPHSDQTLALAGGGDLLELNLTHELWTFPSLQADLGEIPNRVAGNLKKDVFLRGIPYTQLVRDVTDTAVEPGKRILVDRLGENIDPNEKKKKLVQDIHFEPGLFIHVPTSLPVADTPTISRMASIPHGTTINCQGAAATKVDGKAAPDIKTSQTASTPFQTSNAGLVPFEEFDVTVKNVTRLPQDLDPFTSKKTITKEMVQDPNSLLLKHNEGKTFSQVIKFTLSTTPFGPLARQACPHLAARDTANKVDKALADIDKQINDAKDPQVRAELTKARGTVAGALKDALNIVNQPTPSLPADIAARDRATAPAIGSSNIAFLDGNLGGPPNPNARTGKVDATFWISTVVYTLNVTQKFTPGKDAQGKPKVLQLDPIEKDKLDKDSGIRDTVPSFIFPSDKEVQVGKYSVEATQIQYSQTVNLIFNTLVWPHISVATIIPVRPVLVKMAKKLP